MLVGEKPITFMVKENATHSARYFTYEHKSLAIRVVSTYVITEFLQPLMILVVAFTLAILLSKRIKEDGKLLRRGIREYL
ncbi:MAG: hypothetical protein QXX95_05045 [Nitrososphaerales archaeon]